MPGRIRAGRQPEQTLRRPCRGRRRFVRSRPRATRWRCLGPSGCGKTTILRCHRRAGDAGRRAPSRSAAAWSSTAPPRINLMPEGRELGIVFQSYAVWPHMTVAENVGFPLKVRGVAKAEQRERVARILEIVGLSAPRDKPATQLTGGQQQRVALARALVHEPRLVLVRRADVEPRRAVARTDAAWNSRCCRSGSASPPST